MQMIKKNKLNKK